MNKQVINVSGPNNVKLVLIQLLDTGEIGEKVDAVYEAVRGKED